MSELKLTDLDMDLAPKVGVREKDDFQRRAALAKEPDLRSLQVGDDLEAFTPVHRHCKVVKVVGDSCIVSSLRHVGKRHRWHEVWAVKEIRVPYIQPENTIWRKETHVIVIEEDRSTADSKASAMVPICPKTRTNLDENGELFSPYLSIVTVVPLEKLGAIQTTSGGQREVQGGEQGNRPSDEQKAEEQGSGGPALESPVRKRPGRPKGSGKGVAKVEAPVTEPVGT